MTKRTHQQLIRDAIDRWFYDCEERMLIPTDSGCKPRSDLKQEKTRQKNDRGLKRK
jgi:hypothetical protein